MRIDGEKKVGLKHRERRRIQHLQMKDDIGGGASKEIRAICEFAAERASRNGYNRQKHPSRSTISQHPMLVRH